MDDNGKQFQPLDQFGHRIEISKIEVKTLKMEYAEFSPLQKCST